MNDASSPRSQRRGAERCLGRDCACGRSLFAGSDAGGERAALLYSLIVTCRLNGIEPFAYFQDLLDRIADHPITRIDELLPWTRAPEHANAAVA